MGKHPKIPPMNGMPPAVDLASLREPQTPGSLDIQVIIKYAMNCYADVNDAVPFLGIIDTDTGAGPPAIALIDEGGTQRFYMLAPNTIETLQQFLGIARYRQAIDAARQLVDGLLGDPETIWQDDKRAKLDEVLLLLTDGIPEDETAIEDPSS